MAKQLFVNVVVFRQNKIVSKDFAKSSHKYTLENNLRKLMWRPDTDIKHDIQLTFDISMWLTTVDKGDVKTCTVPNNNLKLGIQVKPVTEGADATEYVWPMQKPDIYSCISISSIWKRLRLNAENQLIFGTVWLGISMLPRQRKPRTRRKPLARETHAVPGGITDEQGPIFHWI